MRRHSHTVRAARFESLESRKLLTAQMLLDYTTMPIGLNPEGFIEYQGELFFSTRANEDRSLQIWKTDGTAIGTHVTVELAGYRVPYLKVVNDQLLAFVEDTVPGNIHGAAEFDLYRYDGETFSFAHELTLEQPYGPEIFDDFVAASNGQTYFTSYDGGPAQISLWSTNGVDAVRELGASNLFKEITPVGPLVFTVHPKPERTGTSSSSGELYAFNVESKAFSLVRDIVPGKKSSEPRQLTNVNGSLFFTAKTDSEGRELWRSDGTTLGTQPVANLMDGVEGSDPADLVVRGDYLYFTADDGLGRQVWFTDSIASEPVKISDSKTAPVVVQAEGNVFFTSVSNEQTQLFMVDGGSANEVGTFESTNVTLTQFGNQLIVRATTSDTIRFWVSGETNELVAEFSSSEIVGQPSEIELLSSHNGSYTFKVGDSLYRSSSDDTQANLVGTFPTSPTEMIAYGELLVYAAESKQGSTLWVSDGETFEVIQEAPSLTKSSTVRFVDVGPGPLLLLENGFDRNQFRYDCCDNHFFEAALFTSDGTTSGTKSLGEGVKMPEFANLWGGVDYYVSDGTVYFYPGSSTSSRGSELWVSDLTRQGTGAVSDADELAEVAPILEAEFFGEGTLRQTTRLQYGNNWYRFAEGDDGDYFVANNNIIRRSESTFTTLVELSDLGITTQRFGWDVLQDVGFAFSGGLFYFSGKHPETGTEFWQSDGTLSGTSIVHDVNPGPADSNATVLGDSNGVVYFTANDGVHGREVWVVTDETPSGSDLNNDGATDFADFLILSDNFGNNAGSREEGDINGDLVVDFADFLLFSTDFKATRA